MPAPEKPLAPTIRLEGGPVTDEPEDEVSLAQVKAVLKRTQRAASDSHKKTEMCFKTPPSGAFRKNKKKKD